MRENLIDTCFYIGLGLGLVEPVMGIIIHAGKLDFGFWVQSELKVTDQDPGYANNNLS